jgi:hypothetical protein
MHRYVRTAGCVAVYTMLATGHVTAQKPDQRVAPAPAVSALRDSMPLKTWLDSIPLTSIPDSIRRRRMVHVSPHLVVFAPDNRTATLEFRNGGPFPAEADVQVQFGYTYWQNEDTLLVPAPGQRSRGYDTVFYNPRPEDRSAVEWLSGVPTHITLGPHEKRQVTLRIDPPANLPDGEYYARIVTLVGTRAKRSAVSQDVKQAYRYPLKGWELPVIRDSVRMFYRKGPQTMGLEVVRAKAKLDPLTAPPADDEIDVGQNPLQVMVQLRLTGTTHFEGVFRMSYVSENGDEIQLTASEGAALSVHRDGIIRWVAQTNHLPLGRRYHLRLRFIATQDEFPEEHRLPMKPIDIELPIHIPATGMRAPAVSTGQDLAMGGVDPYWSYLPGVVNGALSQRGSPAIVDTAYNYSNRDLWPWAMRTLTPANNVNVGWLHPERAAWRASPLGGNTMRTVVDLPASPSGKIARLTGMVWSDGRMLNIYVNGRPLSSFDVDQTNKPSKEGYTFRIRQSDGLVSGQNVLDFVWLLKHKPRPDGVTSLFAPWYVIRVDFNMIFREMHNR